MKLFCDAKVLGSLLDACPEIPDGECDGAHVSHETLPASHEHTVVSWRNAIMTGYPPQKAITEYPLTIRELIVDDQRLMTTSPQEVSQLIEPVFAAHGAVLVGGLGLGALTHLLTEVGEAYHTFTVEIDQRVVNLVAPHLDDDGYDNITRADIHNFCRDLQPDEYDWACLDTWGPTGEMAWVEHVLPLRRLLRGKVENVWCWAEAEMRGQLIGSLAQRIEMDPDLLQRSLTMAHERAIRLAAEKQGIRKPGVFLDPRADPSQFMAIAPFPNRGTSEPIAAALVNRFLDVSSETWEAEFGDLFDRCVEEARKEMVP